MTSELITKTNITVSHLCDQGSCVNRKVSVSLIKTVGELAKSQSSSCEEERDRSTKQLGVK